MRPPETKISLLIVENNVEDQLLLQQQLHSSQLDIADVIVVSTCEEARILLQSRTFSLVLLNLYLPDSKGLQSLTNLMLINARVPFVILSGSSDQPVSMKALSLGAQDFLTKGDYNEKVLEKTVSYSIERHKNLETIEEIVERFNLVSMATHDMVWDWNVKTGEIYRSKETWKIILMPNAGINGIDEQNLHIHPGDREKVKGTLENIFLSKTLSLFEIECRVLVEEDAYVYVRDRGYVIRDAEGSPVRLIGATQDITPRKEAEQKVLLSEKRFKSLVQSGSDIIAILDENGVYTYISPTSLPILGYAPDSLIGKNAFSFVHPADQQRIRPVLEDMKIKGSVDLIFYRFKDALGQWRWLETNFINLLNDEAVCGIVANSRDITSKKQAEEKEAREKILRQKEITDAIISAQEDERSEIGRELHDNVNQLLGATRLYIDMARKNCENREAYLESSSTYTLTAIDEIRKLSKTLITPMIRELGLVESVKDMIEDIMQVHAVKIIFVSSNFEEDRLNEKFKLNLFRIVQEQINNTLKHAKANVIQIDFNEFADYISIGISDDGVGFDPSVSRKGVGINNILSRAELYKGLVEIDSSPGKGFKLTILFNEIDLLIN